MSSKHLLRIFLALLLLSVTAHASDKISKETFDSRGKQRTYYLFVPSSVEGKSSVPLVVMLHGSGRNGLSLVERWKDLASAEGFIVAGPDSKDPQKWSTTDDGTDLIRDLVETLRAKYPINPRRVYLFGHSAGAVFALNLSMMESEYFAAVALHAGSWRDREDFALPDFAKRKTPISIFIGDRDQFFSVESVRATEAALKGRGHTIEVTVIKGHDHSYYDIASEINRSAWDFLKRYELDREPKYETYNDTGQAPEVNTAIKEINALRAKFNDALQLLTAGEEAMKAKNYEKGAVAEIARGQIKIITVAEDALREAALKSERLGKLKLRGSYAEYFSILAESCAKRAGALEAMRERAEALLGDDEPNTITNKMNEAAERFGKLNAEAEELEQRAERVRAGKGQ